MNFPVKYSEILTRIQQIKPSKYAFTRNFLDGEVTYLSPYLTHGVISLPQVRDSILAKTSFAEAEKLIQELSWKEYFRRVWENLGEGIFEDIKHVEGPKNSDFSSLIINSNTGIEVLDQQITQLYEVGYMHNHARMWVASLACNVFNFSWKQGANWMYYHLLDGDLASNYLSWQWVAGSFSNKKYYANQENINKYSGKNQFHTILDVGYDQLSSLSLTHQQTESESLANLKTDLSVVNSNYSGVKKSKLLLYHPWSLSPVWKQTESDWQRVLVIEPSHFNRYPISPQRLNFILALAAEIPGLEIFVGEVASLPGLTEFETVLSIAYPATKHFPGQKEGPDYLYPQISKYYPSFFGFWKQASRVYDR